jgi:hypothetical protein
LRASAKQEKVGGQLDEALVCARDTEKAMNNALKFSSIRKRSRMLFGNHLTTLK